MRYHKWIDEDNIAHYRVNFWSVFRYIDISSGKVILKLW